MVKTPISFQIKQALLDMCCLLGHEKQAAIASFLTLQLN